MSDTHEPLPPGFTARLNLLVDLLVLLAGVTLAGFHLASVAVLLAVSVWLVLGFVQRRYDAGAYAATVAKDAGSVSVRIIAFTLALLVGQRLAGGAPRADALVVLLACWPLLLAMRLLAFRSMSSREAPHEQVLIVGAGALGRNTALDVRRAGRRTVLAQLCFNDDQRPGWDNATELDRVLRATPVDEVFIAGHTFRQGTEMQEAIRVCERLGVPFALPSTGFRFGRARLVDDGASDGYQHYLSVEPRHHERTAKRLFDIVAAGAAVLVLSPLLLAVAALIKLTSKGPVFFRQQRGGLHGRPFEMLKFRSMCVGAEAQRAVLEAKNEQSGPVFKMKNDPRVTAIGRFIRKHSIDELPQLFDVLAGDMSVVGPRPPLLSEVAKYESWQRRRLSVRPGLTCIWQVSGRNQISFEEWMGLDMQYIDHWSLGADLQLILKTIPVVLAGHGAS